METESASKTTQNRTGWGFLCRQGYEEVLRREILQHPLLGKYADIARDCEIVGEGLVLIRGDAPSQAAAQVAEGPPGPLVFERQRLPRAQFFSLSVRKDLAASVAGWAAAGLREAHSF